MSGSTTSISSMTSFVPVPEQRAALATAELSYALRSKLACVLGRVSQIFNGHHANISLLQVGPGPAPRRRITDSSPGSRWTAWRLGTPWRLGAPLRPSVRHRRGSSNVLANPIAPLRSTRMAHPPHTHPIAPRSGSPTQRGAARPRTRCRLSTTPTASWWSWQTPASTASGPPGAAPPSRSPLANGHGLRHAPVRVSPGAARRPYQRPVTPRRLPR
jgi:hypothetical protein